ncbi:MAG: DUF1902 domain-containing protein [Alphaproteobacteria bacterium]
MEKRYYVTAEWDDDAKCWYVKESDVPGLFAEADTLEAFEKEIFELIPVLIRLNNPKLKKGYYVDLSHRKHFKHAS